MRTLVLNGRGGDAMGKVIVRREREVLRAYRGHRLLVPESNVPQRAVSVLVQCMCPRYAGSGKYVRCFVEAPADRLPRQRPTVLLDMREGLLHL